MSTRTVRVCMVVNNLDVGGLEKVTLDLLNGLKGRGFDMHLICLNGEGKLFHRAGLPPDRVLVHRLEQKKLLGFSVDLTLLNEIRAFLRDRQIDLVHAHNWGPLIYSGLAARFVRRRPVVVYSEHNQLNSASAGAKRRFRYYLKLADHVIAVSHDLARQLTEGYQATRPMEVIHNGIAFERPNERDRAEARQLFGAAPDEFVVGTVGVLSRQKGIIHFLQCAKVVARALPRARFVVIGDGPLRVSLEEDAKNLGLGDRVRFMGYRGDVPRMLAGCDVYVQSSLWEGLPLALLEALASGKPIVATAVGGTTEVVEDGLNGLIVKPGDAPALADAILRTERDDSFRARASAANLQKFRDHFRVDAMISAHANTFLRVTEPRSRPS
jgi:glycosyltransferase involved in cell wall biosynthesis